MNAVSEAVDQQVRDSVKSSSIETREAIFEDLLRELMEVEPDATKIPLHSASGDLLGFFLRPAPITAPPRHSAEEEMRHLSRLATLDDVIDGSELVRRVTEKLQIGSQTR